MKMDSLSKAGITLLEILIALGILAFIGVITFNVFSNFRHTSALNSATEEGVSLLVEARSQTLSSQNAMQYGVHFESGRMVLFQGSSYVSGDPANQVVPLPAGVEISTISLGGGGSEVVFQRLTGQTSNFGTVTFRSTSDPTKTRIINIQQAGAVGLL